MPPVSRKRLVVPAFAALALLAGCGAETGPPTLIEPAAAPARQQQPAQPVSVNAADVKGLGAVLTDQNGKTLYLFTKDNKNPPTTTCVATCAEDWPPLMASGGDLRGTGVDPALLGTVARPDGSLQVTVGDWPVYTFTGDTGPGQANGQGRQDVWFAVTPLGTKAGQPAAKPTAVVSTEIPGFGNALTDQDGRTLYLFAKDSKDPSESRCEGACAEKWPPMPATADVKVTGFDPELLGTVVRTDGSEQVTVGGWPVYTFTGDTAPGQTNGHGFDDVWFVIEKEGCKSTAPLPSDSAKSADSRDSKDSKDSDDEADTGY
jgi:predicted lipoprotein with Yx(FWY)xxD motif